MTLDPVTLAVIQNGLRQVASEMDLVHEKTSSRGDLQAIDRSNGIYDRTTGEVVAQGELGLPIFVGVMQFTTQAVIARRRDLEPGDVIFGQRPLSRRHPSDGRQDGAPVLLSRPPVELSLEYRPLAGYRGHGAGRLFRDGDRDRAGGPAPAACEARPAGRDLPGHHRHRAEQHPGCRRAGRRHPRATRGAQRRREATDGIRSTRMASRPWTPPSPS